MLLMKSAVRTISVACLLAAMLASSGCRKPEAPPEADQRAPAATRPSQPATAAVKKHSEFWLRRKARLNRTIERLSDAEKWRRTSLAALRQTANACETILSDPLTHIRAGDKALANGQTELSIACFTRAADMAPKNEDAHMGLAVAISAMAAQQRSILKTRKLYRRAAEAYRKILAINAGNETARFNLGLALMRSGSPSQADEVFRPLLTSEKFAVQATFNLAMALSSQGKLNQAESLLRRLLDSSRKMGSLDTAAAYTHLGEVLVDLGDKKGALQAYKEAAKLTPKDMAAWLNLAAAARADGSYGYAVTATRKAAALSPFNAEIHLRLGNLLLELHRATEEDRFLTEAVEAWRDSVKIDPSQTDLRRRIEIYSRKTPATKPAS